MIGEALLVKRPDSHPIPRALANLVLPVAAGRHYREWDQHGIDMSPIQPAGTQLASPGSPAMV